MSYWRLCSAPLDYHNIFFIGECTMIFKSISNYFIHTNSLVVNVITRYSASVLDLAITFLFFIFSCDYIFIYKCAIAECRFSIKASDSICISTIMHLIRFDIFLRIPFWGAPFKYHKILSIAFK
jgi:hypothetical protein